MLLAPARQSQTRNLTHNVHDKKEHTKRPMPEQPKQPSIAERIKAERERCGLSQSAAARKWKINLQTLQSWEQGRREPRGLYREALERALRGGKVGRGD